MNIRFPRLIEQEIHVRSPLQAIFAETASDMGDLLHIIVPAFDPVLRFGPARWQARDAVSKPTKGDKCLVVQDDRDEWWVIAWWPFDS